MKMEIGSEAPHFELPGVDGYGHSLDEYADATLLVLVQSCNHCPYVQAWEDRLIAIANDFAYEGVRVVAINSNDVSRYPEDSFEQMRARAKERGFSFDYLFDEDQSLARALGAESTPEVFLFDAQRKLRYHGAIDNSRDENAVTRSYLREAIDALMAGEEPPTAETGAPGCSVKWTA
jgi:peroxiredoxin